MKIGLGIGIGLGLPGGMGGQAGLGAGGPPSARIILDNNDIDEDAAVGATIGGLSVINGSGSYTFSITADPDGKFQIDGSDLEVGDELDYEVSTSHHVTIEADNGVDPPISKVFTVLVNDVDEGVDYSPSLDFSIAANSQYVPLIEDI